MEDPLAARAPAVVVYGSVNVRSTDGDSAQTIFFDSVVKDALLQF